jgi:hypothetical protein
MGGLVYGVNGTQYGILKNTTYFTDQELTEIFDIGAKGSFGNDYAL